MNRITAATSAADILAPVERAKQALLDEVTKTVGSDLMGGDRMVSLAQNVKSAEAVASAQMHYQRVVANKPEMRLHHLFDLISRGADDAGSGRRNDSNRSAHDAVVAWARMEADEIRYEESVGS